MSTVSPPQMGCLTTFGMHPLKEQPVHKRIPFTKSVTTSAMKTPTSEEEEKIRITASSKNKEKG